MKEKTVQTTTKKEEKTKQKITNKITRKDMFYTLNHVLTLKQSLNFIYLCWVLIIFLYIQKSEKKNVSMTKRISNKIYW